jgi:HK97 family phage major capsid protein
MPAKTRADYLALAESFITAGTFSKETEARFRSALRLAELAGGEAQRKVGVIEYESPGEERSFREWIATGKYLSRDLAEGDGAFPGSSGSGFVPVGFYGAVISRLKLIDQLWDPDLVTVLKTPRGSAFAIPLDSDVDNQGVVIAENAVGTSADQDPLMGVLALPECPTVRASCFVSRELVSDSGIPLDTYLSKKFATRFERAFGPVMVAALVNGAAATTTALGATGSDQTMQGSSSASTSIGSDDLVTLAASIDGAYLERASWVMRPATYLAILGLRGATPGLRVFHEKFDDDGNPLLLGKRVVFAPAMPGLGASKKPVVFGDLSRLVIRQGGEMTLAVSAERRPEYGQYYYRAMMRLQAAAAIDTTLSPADAPFAVLTMGS